MIGQVYETILNYKCKFKRENCTNALCIIEFDDKIQIFFNENSNLITPIIFQIICSQIIFISIVHTDDPKIKNI